MPITNVGVLFITGRYNNPVSSDQRVEGSNPSGRTKNFLRPASDFAVPRNSFKDTSILKFWFSGPWQRFLCS